MLLSLVWPVSGSNPLFTSLVARMLLVYTTDTVQNKDILLIVDKDIEQDEPMSKIFDINIPGIIVIFC